MPLGIHTNCSFPPSKAQERKFFTFFFDIVTIRAAGKGLGYNMLMQFSTLGNSKMEIFKTDFSNILTLLNDQISYVKHVLDPLYVFPPPYLGVGGGMGGF